MTQENALNILKSGANVFLTGEPGAGKTFTIGKFVEWMNESRRGHAITASTGIAASHLNGSTIHSWAGLGIRRALEREDLDGIAHNRFVTDRVRGARTLVIDEVSMIDAVTLEDVDAVLKTIHGNVLPFGGVQVVLVGDFFQLPPVNRDGGATFAFESPVWEEANLITCYLTEQHRQSDGLFLDILSAIRHGTMTGAFKQALGAAGEGRRPDTRLFTHNVDVEALNDAELAKLKGEPQSYDMTSDGPEKAVETLKRQCLSPEHLVLKEGAVVMFTRNNFKEGYVNGSIGNVVRFSYGEPVVELLNGRTVTPEIAEWTLMEDRKPKATVRQVPLRLAWAITVHKSQGMSLDAAAIDLSKAFEFGQGYVAISRVRSLAGLHLDGVNDRAFEVHPKVVAKDAVFRSESAALEL